MQAWRASSWSPSESSKARAPANKLVVPLTHSLLWMNPVGPPPKTCQSRVNLLEGVAAFFWIFEFATFQSSRTWLSTASSWLRGEKPSEPARTIVCMCCLHWVTENLWKESRSKVQCQASRAIPATKDCLFAVVIFKFSFEYSCCCSRKSGTTPLPQNQQGSSRSQMWQSWHQKGDPERHSVLIGGASVILGKSILCKASWLQVLLKQKSLGEVGARMAKVLHSRMTPTT